MTDDEMIQNARSKGAGRCFTAKMRLGVSGGPPPPPGLPNPMIAEQLRAQKIARRIFKMQDVDLDKVAKIVGEMGGWLTAPSLEIVKEKPGKDCVRNGAFVVGNRPPIHLCPWFFKTSEEQQIRTMIHEAAHLVGLGDAEDESYYIEFHCDGDGPMFQHVADGGSVKFPRPGPKQADTWGLFIHCMVGLPSDKEPIPGPEPTSPYTPPPTPKSPQGSPSLPESKIHTVVWGDYLVKLAVQYYGNGALWPRIYNANRATIGPDPNKIYPGQRLAIP